MTFNPGEIVKIGSVRPHDGGKYGFRLDPSLYIIGWSRYYNLNAVKIVHKLNNSPHYKIELTALKGSGVPSFTTTNIEEDYLYKLKIKLK